MTLMALLWYSWSGESGQCALVCEIQVRTGTEELRHAPYSIDRSVVNFLVYTAQHNTHKVESVLRPDLLAVHLSGTENVRDRQRERERERGERETGPSRSGICDGDGEQIRERYK